MSTKRAIMCLINVAVLAREAKVLPGFPALQPRSIDFDCGVSVEMQSGKSSHF